LALELKPFGIQCCSILPGDTKTEFTAARKYTAASQSTDSAYNAKMKKSVGKMEKDEQNGVDAKLVANKIVSQVLSKKMKVSVVPGIDYKIICFLFNRLPANLRLWVVGLIYG
jgi:short-subunit dehydrogenase